MTVERQKMELTRTFTELTRLGVVCVKARKRVGSKNRNQPLNAFTTQNFRVVIFVPKHLAFCDSRSLKDGVVAGLFSCTDNSALVSLNDPF